MYLFELEKAELWTRNSTEEPWTLERKITTPGNPDFYLPYSQFSSDKKYFRILASFSWSPSPAEEAKFLRQNIIAFIPLCIRYIRFR